MKLFANLLTIAHLTKATCSLAYRLISEQSGDEDKKENVDRFVLGKTEFVFIISEKTKAMGDER